MTTNIQSFAGDVEIPGNLQVKRLTVEDAITELGANNAGLSNVGFVLTRQANTPNVAVYYDETTSELRIGHTLKGGGDTVMEIDSANNVTMNVFGDVECNFIRADGGLLSNIVSDLQSVTTYGSSTDRTVTLSNVTTGLIVDSNVVVTGNVTAGSFIGDGSQLDGIAANFEEIIINGNVTSNTVEFRDSATSLITTGSVGIINTAPGHDLSVGANLYVEELGSNVLTVEGNVSAHKMTLGTIEITPAYSLQQVTGVGNSTSLTVEFTNTSTAFVTTGMAGVGIAPLSSDVGVSGLHVDGHIRLGGAAGTDENQDLYVKSAAQLTFLANDSDLDNSYVGASIRAGVSNASFINVLGSATDVNSQNIALGVKNTEMMRIRHDGNVGIGTNAPAYKLDVAGTSNASAYYQNSQLVRAQRKWDIDLTAQSTSYFYPVELKSSTSPGVQPSMEPVHFKVYGVSLAGSDSFNENTLVGYVRGGGYSDHHAMFDVHIRQFQGAEIRFLGVYTGATGYVHQVIYMRGGYAYAALTDAIDVIVHTTATSYIPDSTGSVFAIKDANKNDVSGTSANVVLQVDLTDTTKLDQRYTSGSTYITDSLNVGSTTHVPNASVVMGGINTMLDASTTLTHNLTYDSGWKYVNANQGGSGLRFENSGMQYLRAGTGGTAGGGATVVYDMVISNTGNVCVGGSTTPAYKLEVVDTIHSSKTLAPGTISTSVTRNDAKFLFYDIASTNWSGMGTDGGGRFWLTTGTGGTRELFVMDSLGNVGIGRTDPRSKLDVKGILQVSDTSTNNGTIIVGENFTNPTTRYGNYVVGNSTYVNNPGTTPVYSPNLAISPNQILGGTMWAAGAYGTPTLYGGDLVLYGGDINASGNDGTGAANYHAGHTYIQGGVAFTGGSVSQTARTYNGSIYFQTGVSDDTSSTDSYRYIRMAIKPGGNVGIGTSAPVSKLQVYGSSNQAGASDATLTFQGDGAYPAVSNLPAIYHRAFVGLALSSDYQMSFEVNGANSRAEAMRIDSYGNVGIATTNPLTKLNVLGPYAIHPTIYNDSYSNSACMMVSQNYYNVEDARTAARHYSTLILSSDHAYNSGNNAAGSIGFAAKNEFAGYTVQYGQISGVRVGNFYGGLSFATMHNLNDGILRENMRIVNGNVGIATTSPGSRLHIVSDSLDTTAGTDPSATGYAQLEITSATNSTLGAPMNLQIGVDHRGPYGFLQGVTDYIYPSPIVLQPYSGNVGVGTLAPRNKLHVMAPNPYVDGLSVQGNDVQMVLGNRHGGFTSGTIQVFSAVTNSQPTTSSNKYTLELNPLGGSVIINTQSTAPSNFMRFGNHSSTSDQINVFYLEGRKANADGAFAQLYFRNSSDTGAKSVALQAEREGNNYGTKFRIFTTNTSGVLNDVLTMNAAGNVGIGSAIPGCTLDVNGVVESPICKRNGTAATTTYNYILNGPRPGETGGGAVHFINGSGRTADGGASAYTIRNDNGPLILGSASSATKILNEENGWMRLSRTNTYIAGATPSGGSTFIVVPYTAAQGFILQWNATNNEYTCPHAGDYMFTANFMAYPDNTVALFGWMQIRKRNSSGVLLDGGEQLGMHYIDHNSYRAFHGTQMHNCAAGDKIDVLYYIQAHSGQVAQCNLHQLWGNLSIHCIRRTAI